MKKGTKNPATVDHLVASHDPHGSCGGSILKPPTHWRNYYDDDDDDNVDDDDDDNDNDDHDHDDEDNDNDNDDDDDNDNVNDDDNDNDKIQTGNFQFTPLSSVKLGFWGRGSKEEEGDEWNWKNQQ